MLALEMPDPAQTAKQANSNQNSRAHPGGCAEGWLVQTEHLDQHFSSFGF
jgi:hypothetical protein